MRILNLLLSSLFLLSFAQPAGSEAIDPARAFAASYNHWIGLHQTYDPRVLSASELKAWQDVKQRWKDLQRYADGLY